MIKRFFPLFFLSIFPLLADPLKVELASESAILINMDTGRVLFEKQSDKRHYPASTTKIATALYALKLRQGDLQKMVTADRNCLASVKEEDKRRSNYALSSYLLEPGGSHIGLKRGETLSLKDLLIGMMVASGNDAANVIAKEVGGSIEAFMDGVNGCVKELGCKDTFFCNPHGLHNPKHQTTARDLAIIAKEAMKNPVFRQIVALQKFERPETNKQNATTFLQTNKLLRKGKFYYPKAIGIKTGCLTIAQNTLVAAASSNGRTLLAVMLKCKEREEIFKDATRLFETAFKEAKMRKKWVDKESFVLVLPSDVHKSGVRVKALVDFDLEYYPSEEVRVKSEVEWLKSIADIEKGQVVAELILTDEGGNFLASIPLAAQESYSNSVLGWFFSIYGLGLSIVIVVLLLFLLCRNKRS